MGLMAILTLPIRLTVATTQAALGMGALASPDGPLRRKGGYADQLSTLLELADRLNKLLADPHGPIALLNNLSALTADDRPLGKAIASGGALDRVLAEDGVLERFTSSGGPVDRLLSQDGALERLLSAQGPLDRLLSEVGALDRITEQGGVLELLLREQGLADRLLAENGFVEKLTADGGTLDQLLRLGDVLNQLQDSVLVLNRAVGPLGELANRVPSSLLRRRGGESVRPEIASS